MSFVRSCGWVSVALYGVAAAASCRQILGVEDREPPVVCVAEPEGSSDCVACLRDACCDESSACEDEASCSARARCWASCPPDDFECARACDAEPPPTEAWAAFRSCAVGRCAAACGGECGGTVAPLSGCSPCADNCCAAGAACAGDLDCQMLAVCRAECNEDDVSCHEVCANEHPAGASLDQDIADCLAESCGLSEDWSCIGDTIWPQGTQADIELHVVAQKGIDYDPAAGATLTACYAALPDCTDPAAEPVVVSTNGSATLSIPVVQSLGEYIGFLELLSPDTFPTLYFFYPPLTKDTGRAIHAYLYDELVQLAGTIELLPGFGHLLVVVEDCRGGLGNSTQVTVEPANEEMRVVDISDDGTNKGAVWVFNVAPGLVQVSASIVPTCTTIGAVGAIVREGFMTELFLPPTP